MARRDVIDVGAVAEAAGTISSLGDADQKAVALECIWIQDWRRLFDLANVVSDIRWQHPVGDGDAEALALADRVLGGGS